MIVVTSCLRATYASGRLRSGLLTNLLNLLLPLWPQLRHGIPAVTEKYTEKSSARALLAARRMAGATLVLLPFHLRGKHPRRDQRAPRSTQPRNIDCSNEFTSFQFGSSSPPSRWKFPQFLIPSVAFQRQLQSHPRTPQTGRLVG
jgi:hypothetical protein